MQQQASASAAADAQQAACRALMQQALQHLQLLAPATAAAAGGEGAAAGSAPSRKLQRAAKAAAAGLHDLLAALEGVMEGAAYLESLLQLARHPSDRVARRALKLFAARVAAARSGAAAAAAAGGGDAAAAAEAALAEAAMGICGEAGSCLAAASAASALTKQAMLLALDATTRAFGRARPAPVLACLPCVVALARDAGAPPAVRSSAVACLAAAGAALGGGLVPRLPEVMAAVLAAGEGGRADLEAAGGEEEDEAAALQVAGSMAALEALTASLGAFLSPYLPRMLGLLLAPSVLATAAGGAAAAAGRVRAMLPTALPARLLLEPLYAAWDGALGACVPGGGGAGSGGGVRPALALLDLTAATASHMESKAAAGAADTMLTFVLRVLDTRQRWQALQQQREVGGGGGDASLAALGVLDVHAIEGAGAGLLLALTMKLSEARFKPLFMRLMEWAASAGAGGGAAASGRGLALLAAVCALTRRLRSVFVPYFRHLMDLLVVALLGGEAGAAGAGGRPSKKAKKAAAAAGQPAAGAGADDALAAQAAWLARLRAVRALHLCFLHDGGGGGFLDGDRFERLLPALVAQLRGGAPPAEWEADLAAQAADAELDAAVTPGARSALDAPGRAAVGALAQLAVAAGGEAQWKPLNHALLSAARGAGSGGGGAAVRTRLLALEAVAALVARLREEYLVRGWGFCCGV